MLIRKAEKQDLEEILTLFLNTIQNVNQHDYTAEQLKVWQSGADDRQKWVKKLDEQQFLVAEEDGEITGFSSISKEGYLDTLFIHKYYQRKGIAKKLLSRMVEYANQQGVTEIITEASITARPFFERHGFKVVNKQILNRKNIKIPNYKMRMILGRH